MKLAHFAFVLLAAACTTTPQPQLPAGADNIITTTQVLPTNVTLRPASWYSEQVKVSGRLFTPVGPSDGAARPAVVLAPDQAATAESLDAYAIALARQGIIALTTDYRGWGQSGGHIYLGERIDTYDKMRFSEQTPELVIRRGRIDPDHQVQDLRNAITFLQGSPGIDRARIGILGVGLGGGHVVSVLAQDARAKAGVAISPVTSGHGEPEQSFVPDAATQAAMIRLAREGAPPKSDTEARERNRIENALALAEYKPWWRLDAIPETTALRFMGSPADPALTAATRALKGPTDVQPFGENAPVLAAEWFAQRLNATP
jgi:dienelactone hydrolase